MVLEAGEEFGDVADANGAAGGGLEGAAACEKEVDAVFVVFPFGVGEEAAEGGVAEGDGFVGAERLRAVCVGDGPAKRVANHGAETFGGVGEVDLRPLALGVDAAEVEGRVGVRAVEVAGESVVPGSAGAAVFDGENEGGVEGPVEAEEASEEVFGGFHHAILGCGAGDDFRAVVEVPVHVLVEGAGVEQPFISSAHTFRVCDVE